MLVKIVRKVLIKKIPEFIIAKTAEEMFKHFLVIHLQLILQILLQA
jgi:hypothetical protein